jgi:oligopeptidase B
MKSPVARKIPVTLVTAGHKRIDDYFWMKERDQPQTLAYLEAENTYTKAMMEDTEELQSLLFAEITSRIKQDDQSVPYFKNGYYYYTRYEKDGEYPVYCRREGTMDAKEEIMLNGNEMAEGHGYFQIESYEVSPDNTMLAYGVDLVGRRLYTVMVKNLLTGGLTDTKIEGTSGSFAWANDNRTLFYCMKNPETLRSETLMAHDLAGCQPDRRILTEEDEAFDLDVYRSKSDELIMLLICGNDTTEYRFLNVNNPQGTFRVVQPRERNMEYQVTHHRDKFYIVTNDRAKNFRLVETCVSQPSKEYWKELIPHREDIFLEDIELFDGFMVIAERKNGLLQMYVRSLRHDTGHYIDFGEEVYTAHIAYNPSFNTDQLRFTYSSLTTPNSVYDYDMQTGKKVLRKQQEIVGGYQSCNYTAERRYATAEDGVKIPISLVFRKDTPLGECTPLLLYGYGSYGINVDPEFSVSRISLLDRGFVYAIAHIRGSQYLGREWYDDGKLLNKRNTFTDFIACAEYLTAQKYTGAESLFAMGGSAGGLLMGAVANMRPDLFKGMIASVPFVDVVTTMSDKSLPLTTGEYDEWGNPEEETYYRYMMSYSPYDNVTAQNYPNMLVTAGLHDSQVQYWEPAKWVARLRAFKTDRNLLLLHTNMDAGHSGASGRFERHRETALEYAFLCKLSNNKKITS